MSRLPVSGIRRFAVITLVILLGAAALVRARDQAREDLIMSRLSLISSLRAGGIQSELREARSDAVLWSGFGNVRERLIALEDAWRSMGSGAGGRIRELYSGGNPYPDADRHLLVDAGDGSAYSRVHADFHPRMREFLSVHDYYDVLLVDPEGRVVYSHYKADDFASDLLRGPLGGSGAASAAREALVMDPGQSVFSELQPYGPDGGEWSLFIASPVSLSTRPGHQGALVFQISARRLASHLSAGASEAAAVESSLLGERYRVLPIEPWIEESSESRATLYSDILRRAREEGEGAAVLAGDDGNDRLMAWTPLSFEGLEWVIVSEIGEAEIRAEGTSERRAVGTVTLLIWLAAGVLTLGRRGGEPLGQHEI